MDWLKDKKNLPIIAGVTGLVMAVAVVFLIMQVRQSSEEPEYVSPESEMHGRPAEMPAVPGGLQPSDAPPAVAPVQPPAVTTAAIQNTPAEARPDPFLPLNYKAPPKAPPAPPLYVPSPGRLLPPKIMADQKAAWDDALRQSAPQPQRRMSGLLYNQRLYAILETEGASQVVKPGDITSDGTAKVETIEATKIVLRTLDPKNPQLIEVSMASSNRPSEGTAPAAAPQGPTGPYGPYGPYGPTVPSSPRGGIGGGT